MFVADPQLPRLSREQEISACYGEEVRLGVSLLP